MTKEMENYETHLDRMERERQAQEAEFKRIELVEAGETKRAKLKASEATKEMLVFIVGLLAAAAVLVALALVFWTDFGENPQQQPKVTGEQIEQEREERCIDTGGGWIPEDTFAGSYPDSGLCVYPGRTVEAPKTEN